MKKSSFRRHNIGLVSPGMRSAGAIVLVIVLILGLIRFFAPGAFVAMVSPLWKIGSAVDGVFKRTGDSFGNPRELALERDVLRNDNEDLLRQLELANAQIADMGALVGDTGSESAIVGIMAYPPVAPYDVLILSAGSDAGMQAGRIVYGTGGTEPTFTADGKTIYFVSDRGGTPLGVITEVHDNSSRASLFSEAGRETAGWAGENRIPVALVGTGAGTFRVTVSKDTGLVVGDVVYLPGPGARPVGTISRIDTDPASPDANVHVFPYVNPFSLPYVLVGTALLP